MVELLVLVAVGYLVLYIVIRIAVRDALREHRRALSAENRGPNPHPTRAAFRDPSSG